ncbi:hypothetical protein KJ786_00445 [Patescibacteria group bacterium]|nr:hypothetical protein [Patescibacteria group bacterium]
MAYWIPIIILACLFFSIASLADKLVLSGPPQPKSYVFYIGVLNILVVLLIPFANFGLPNIASLPWIIMEAIVFIVGLYSMFVALERFDVSRVIPTIGAVQPIFIFILTFIFWSNQSLKGTDLLAFIILLIGSSIISFEKNIKISRNYLKITLFAALMFSLEYIFSKFVFLNQPFLQGFIWMRIFSFMFVLFFVLNSNFRKEIFRKQNLLIGKTRIMFFCGQASGGIANFLQSFSIFLAPISFLPIVNSLRGIQYVFLFLITLFFSYFYPKILKEGISKGLIIKKIISILLIVLGLAILGIY